MTRNPATTAWATAVRRRCLNPMLLLLAAAAVVSWMGVGVAPAAAHTELRSSNPPDGQHLTVAPETVELVFGQPIADNFARLVARPSPGGQPTELAVRVDGARVSATVPPDLTRVTTRNRTVWTIAYRVVSEDGHPITGQLRFTVAPAAATTAARQPSTAASAPDVAASAPDVRGRDEVSDGGSQALSTVVIGLFTAVTTVGLMYLLARGRSRGDQP